MKKVIRFSPSGFPFYYGYLIALVGTIGVWASIPGQTVGVSTFTDPVKDALGLSRDQFSASYMAGTLISAFFISSAGRWFDKYGARIVAMFAALMLAATLFVASFSDVISNGIQSLISFYHWVVPFMLMVVLFFLLRFSGQGVLTMASRNVVMKWFERYRGRVNAFSALSISLGFSMAPVLIDKLIAGYQWDGAWRIMALGLVLIAVMIVLFYRDNPEVYGLLPDGRPPSTNCKAVESKELPTVEPEEAFRTRAFWMYAMMLAFNSFFITGFTFHIVSIFESSGYARVEAIAVFIPITVVSVFVSVFFNFISDWLKLKVILYIMILGGFMALTGFAAMRNSWGMYMLIGGLGISGGLFSVINAVAWPRLFGRKYIGTISGKALSLIVFASALAPVVFSLSYTYLKTYSGVSVVAFLIMAFIAIGSVKANNPRLERMEESDTG
jgi:MFS transporter, OFA family, oxalate/formate antiporter